MKIVDSSGGLKTARIMASEGVLSDRHVVVKSIECIKKVISKLDKLQGELDGIQTVFAQFSPQDVFDKPELVLDQLIIYLHCVHCIDWYSDSWTVRGGGGGRLTVRPQSGLVVTSQLGRKYEVESYLRRLTYRVDLFLQVLFCRYCGLENVRN